MAVRSNSRPCANLVPGRRGRHKARSKKFGTRLPGTRSIRIVFVLVYEFWHKVDNSPPAQGGQQPVFHHVAQGRHKVFGHIFPRKVIIANSHIYNLYIYIYTHTHTHTHT